MPLAGLLYCEREEGIFFFVPFVELPRVMRVYRTNFVSGGIGGLLLSSSDYKRIDPRGRERVEIFACIGQLIRILIKFKIRRRNRKTTQVYLGKYKEERKRKKEAQHITRGKRSRRRRFAPLEARQSERGEREQVMVIVSLQARKQAASSPPPLLQGKPLCGLLSFIHLAHTHTHTHVYIYTRC